MHLLSQPTHRLANANKNNKLSVTDVNKVNHARAATQPTCIFTLVLTRAFIQPRTPVELAP